MNEWKDGYSIREQQHELVPRVRRTNL